jgi:pantoate--beta-alanine ligase
MFVTKKISEARQQRQAEPDVSWGLVPTMGFLHEGHLSLVRQAKADNERVAVTIYVNPTQFGPQDDFDSYPRDLERDLAILREEGVDLAFTPTDDEMYPAGFETAVIVQYLTNRLEGAARPKHFQGVTTIVAKLFNIIQPHRAYFGQKDAQQTVVLSQMVHDLNYDLDMIVCPTVREADGLALSSRNKYLNPAERQAATVLYRALQAAKASYDAGERRGQPLRRIMLEIIEAEPLARMEYVSVADPRTLFELDDISGEAMLSLAVRIGRVRLIDNVFVPT